MFQSSKMSPGKIGVVIHRYTGLILDEKGWLGMVIVTFLVNYSKTKSQQTEKSAAEEP